MQKLCHIDIEGISGRKNLALAKKLFFGNFLFFSHLPDNSIFTGWKNSVYFYFIAELDSFKQFKNFLIIKERNMGFFFRLFKVQNKEIISIERDTHCGKT